MVAVAEAVVDKDAMVVKFLDAAIAKVAVVRVFRPQVLTINAHIVKVEVLGDQLVQQLQEVVLLRNIAGLL